MGSARVEPSWSRELLPVPAPALRGVQLLATMFGEPAPPPVLLSDMALVLCDEGGGQVTWGRQRQALTVGSLLVRAPEQLSPVLVNAPPTRCRIVLVSPELLLSASADGWRAARIGSVVTQSPRLCDGVRRLWDAVVRCDDALDQRAELDELVAATVELAVTEAPCPPTLTAAVARTREALHERFAEDVPLKELALLSGMSKCHLVHLFHREVGMPPHAYQIQLRVARARVLVAAGVPLAEVASMTGFADQSHLTRLFKRVVGVPPGQYARLIAAETAGEGRRTARVGDGPDAAANGRLEAASVPRRCSIR
jgi:AraC-like DNA-binding protein